MAQINGERVEKELDFDKIDINSKRKEYLSWEDYFMATAFLAAQRSKDPSSQVGACIVNDEKRIVGVGYNGMPTGCDDEELSWSRVGETYLDTKYAYVCHAEMNAIMNKNSASVKNCTIYVALFPCNECAKLIVQSGIKEVVYYSAKNGESMEAKASRRMFELAGIKYRQHIPKAEKLVIDFSVINKNKSQPTGMKSSAMRK
ncbi:deoxycytidylate deaminase-like [Clytia hemisphaerica]|uniref:dCMP deaminase n=1 Tax=Clytia hemisphaerica TaxID=252671 RepID=A0A7M5VH79_9CNID